MAGIARGRQVDPWRAHLLEPAAATELAYRLAARARQAAIDRPRDRWARGALGAATAVDLWRYCRARRDGPPSRPLWLRALAATVEQAAWSTQSERLDPAVLLGIPFTTEAGIRAGARAAAVPVLNHATARLARRRVGRTTGVEPYAFQGLAVVAGAAFARYDRRRLRRLDAGHRLALAAERRRAELAGAHAVAMGSDNVVDLAARTTLLLRADGRPTRTGIIHQWKAELAASSRQEAAYLTDVLLGWERWHNTSSPRLAHDVYVTAEDADQTLVLREQEAHLRSILEALELSGPVRIRPLGGDVHHPGRALTLLVRSGRDERLVDVPAVDGHVPFRPLETAPFAPALMAVWLAVQALPTGEAVPARRVLPSAVAAVGLAAWAFRRSQRGDPTIVRTTLLGCSTIALGHTALATPRIGSTMTRDGLQPHPFASALWAPLFLLAALGHELDERTKALAWTELAAAVGLGVALHPDRIRIVDVALALHLGAVSYVSVRGWGRSLVAQAAAAEAAHEVERRSVVDAGFAAGAARALGLVEAEVRTLRAELERRGPDLPERVAVEARRRVEELERRTAALAADLRRGDLRPAPRPIP